MPALPGGSSAAPTLYQTMWVTTGARWSGITTTCMPLSSVNEVTSMSSARAGDATAASNRRTGANRLRKVMSIPMIVKEKAQAAGRSAASRLFVREDVADVEDGAVVRILLLLLAP